MRSVDNADLMDRGFAKEELFFQLFTSQGRGTSWNHLPSRCLTEGQAAHGTPIERRESELPAFVERTETCTLLIPPDGRDNRIASPVIRQMIKMLGSWYLLRLHGKMMPYQLSDRMPSRSTRKRSCGPGWLKLIHRTWLTPLVADEPSKPKLTPSTAAAFR